MQDILINWTPQETRVAVVENGAVQDLHLERALERGPGRQHLPGQGGAGAARHAKRVHRHRAGARGLPARGRPARRLRHRQRRRPRSGADASGNAPPPPIERLVFEGQALTVQVIKDPIGTKGARLSTQVSIAGRMLVHLPQDNHIGISQKIGSPELREQLRQRMVALVGKPDEGGGGGFILRTNAEEASDTELADDIAYLRKTWAAIRERAFASPPGTLLHQDLTLAERVLRDLTNDDTQAIRIDSRLQFEHLLAFGAGLHAGRGRQARALPGRAADLRPVQHRRRDPPRAGAPRRPEERRLPDHRPDRGADHGGRQHRRLSSVRATSTTPSSRPTSRPPAPLPASCGCATWAASSSSTSST